MTCRSGTTDGLVQGGFGAAARLRAARPWTDLPSTTGGRATRPNGTIGAPGDHRRAQSIVYTAADSVAAAASSIAAAISRFGTFGRG
jgi:hypothetical protein